MPEGVATQIRERHEEAPLDEEDGRGREREDGVAEDGKVRQQGAQVGGSGRQAGADEEVGEDQQDQVDEGDDAGGPGETHAGEEGLQDEREDDAAHAAARGGEAGCLPALDEEEMPDGGDGRGEDQRGAEPANDAKDDQEVPILPADAEEELGRHQEHAAGQDELAWPTGVKDGADLDAGEEGEEGVDAEDPAHGAFGCGGQLVGGEVGVVGADGVHYAQGHHQAAEGAEDAQPGVETAFGVGVAVGIDRGAFWCCCEVGRQLIRGLGGEGGEGANGAWTQVAGMADRFLQITAVVVTIWCCCYRDRARLLGGASEAWWSSSR